MERNTVGVQVRPDTQRHGPKWEEEEEGGEGEEAFLKEVRMLLNDVSIQS